jgi:hypothetical protein
MEFCFEYFNTVRVFMVVKLVGIFCVVVLLSL